MTALKTLLRAGAAGLLGLALVATGRTAQAQVQDFRVQPPSLAPPGRGSVAGQFANQSFGPADVSRGAFSLPSPFSAPAERGEPGVSPFPTYSPDAGLSEWGIGWRSELAFERWRPVGDIDFSVGDRLRGPWGAMLRGDDGAWYPEGLRTPVRVLESAASLVALLPDGSRWTFGTEPSARIDTGRGTYAWYVTEVESPTGRRTRLRYEPNASGRPYLEEVTYGGVDPERPMSRLAFDYEATKSVRDYRSSKLVYHTKRVKKVHAYARVAEGNWAERWAYDVSYETATRGPGFRLSEVRQNFASGASMPPVSYTYARSEAHLASSAARRVHKPDGLFNSFGPGVIFADKSASFDADEDGRPDFELASDNTLYVQGDDGFVPGAPLPPFSPAADARCRRPPTTFGQPRNLVRMLPHSAEPQVAFFTTNVQEAFTDIGVCRRDGTLLSTTREQGSWTPGVNVAFVDLNRDHLPDVVRVENGRILTLRNESTDTELRFTPGPVTLREPILDVQRLWVVDVNGDGHADVVTMNGAAFRVYYGLGDLRFDPVGHLYQLITEDEHAVSDLADNNLHFVDANKDGLIDVVRNAKFTNALYVNRGDGYFQELPVVSIMGIGGWAARPSLPLDLEGTGNAEIFFTKDNLAHSLALDAPETGLLVAADDGKGTVLRFAYRRALPAPGVASRESVLATMTVESTGSGAVTYEYDYDRPTVHTQGKFLIGYDRVVRRGEAATQEVGFLNEDRYAGVLLSTVESDELNPAVQRVLYREYEDAASFGIAWKRPRREGSGWQSTDPASPSVALDETTYVEYEDEFCASKIEQASEHGVLRSTVGHVRKPYFDGHLTCFVETTTVEGAHADASLDFRHTTRMARNDRGQVTGVTRVGAEGEFVEQLVDYDDAWRVKTVENIGKGVTAIGYAPGTSLAARVTTPDGVITEVTERDPVADQVKTLRVDRGDVSFEQRFRYDELERLAKVWNNLGQASERTPNLLINYRFADAKRPAATTTKTLTSLAIGPTGALLARWSRTAELATAGGEALVAASAIPEGWAFGNLSRVARATRETERYRRGPYEGDVATLDLAALYEDAESVGRTQSSLFGAPVDVTSKYHADVEKHVTSSLRLIGALEETSVENGDFATTSQTDVGRRPTRFRDASGAEWGYRYDALGRVRRIELPGEARHRIDYDDYGRVAAVERQGVAQIAYRYDPVNGRLAEKKFGTPGGATVRSVAYSYDAAGRVTHEEHVDQATGARQSYDFFFDGASPESPQATGRKGLLTAVAGEGFEKRFEHRADGLLRTSRVTYAGFGAIETKLVYYEDGTARDREVSVETVGGEVVSRVLETMRRDPYGRADGTDLNGQAFAGYGYDAEGLLEKATFAGPAAHGEQVVLPHDPLTRAPVGWG